MKRYKIEKLRVSGPIYGFLIHTPSGKTMRDIYPQTICKELNRLNNRIKRLEEELNELRSDESRLLNSNGEFERRINRLLEAGDKMANSTDIREYSVAIQNWLKAKEAKP